MAEDCRVMTFRVIEAFPNFTENVAILLPRQTAETTANVNLRHAIFCRNVRFSGAYAISA
jgi:hypothetical protein